MADPRFYDNRGPLPLSQLCRAGQVEAASGNPDALVYDVAAVNCAGPPHLTFCDRLPAKGDIVTNAGWCIVGRKTGETIGSATQLLFAPSALHSFAAVAALFYPAHDAAFSAQDVSIHPSAKIGVGVTLAAGVVIGPGAEVGDHTQLGPHCFIARGVCIGRSCVIGAHVTVSHAYLGDGVICQAGVAIGSAGFGFLPGPSGLRKMPQLGRVIVQDGVEIGANSTIDRGALADTVIGEGTKIDNLVQIGHNTRVGRNCVIAGQVGISGSVVLGDSVAIGGMAGIADHVTIGDGARLAGLAGVANDLEGGRDYGGIPARPIREWHRQTAWLARMTRGKSRKENDG